MASGRVHALATKVLTPVTVGAALAITHDLDAALITGAGCLSGLLIEPDLDVDGLTRSEWIMIRSKYFWMIGALWFVFWLPYAKAVKHRSPISHAPIIGTIIRLLYLTFVAAMILLPFGLADNWLALLAAAPHKTAFFIGLAVADAGHYLLDKGSTYVKRKFRKRKVNHRNKRRRRAYHRSRIFHSIV